MWRRTGRRLAYPYPPKAFCARDGAVKETRLELEFSRYETYEDKIRKVYHPKGLLAFAAATREYVGYSNAVLNYIFFPISATLKSRRLKLKRPHPPAIFKKWWSIR